VTVSRHDGVTVPRKFSDYDVKIDDENLPAGVTVERKYMDDAS
jgi:hypothetical protein